MLIKAQHCWFNIAYCTYRLFAWSYWRYRFWLSFNLYILLFCILILNGKLFAWFNCFNFGGHFNFLLAISASVICLKPGRDTLMMEEMFAILESDQVIILLKVQVANWTDSLIVVLAGLVTDSRKSLYFGLREVLF